MNLIVGNLKENIEFENKINDLILRMLVDKYNQSAEKGLVFDAVSIEVKRAFTNIAWLHANNLNTDVGSQDDPFVYQYNEEYIHKFYCRYTPSWKRLPLRFTKGVLKGYLEGILRYHIKPIDYSKDILTTVVDDFPVQLARSGNCSNRVIFKRYEKLFNEVISNRPIFLDVVFAKELSFELESLLDDLGLTVSGEFKQKIESWFAKLIGTAKVLLDAILQNNNCVPKELWVGTGGNPQWRLLSLAVMKSGGRVTRFDHAGGGAYLKVGLSKYLNELRCCNRYYTYSPMQAGYIHNMLASESSLPFSNPEVKNLDKFIPWTSYHINSKSIGKRSSKYINKKVMCVMGPRNTKNRYLGVALSSQQYVNWYKKLFHFLKNLGYEVLMKPRPEDLSLAFKLLAEGYGDQIVRQPFEKVISESDIVILDYAASTTFNTALINSIPCVFVDFGYFEFFYDAYLMLKSQISVVDATITYNDFIDIDWDFLRSELLLASQKESSNEFARKTFQFAG